MSRSYTRIWIHFIWTTKHREKLLDVPARANIHSYLYYSIIRSGCHIEEISVQADHVHALVWVRPIISISSLMNDVKGGCSRWVNANEIITQQFEWQKGYTAFSVSEAAVGRVAAYIRAQDDHHGTESYTEELRRLKKNNHRHD